MSGYKFSHTEKCWDIEGYMYLKHWYVSPSGAKKYLLAD